MRSKLLYLNFPALTEFTRLLLAPKFLSFYQGIIILFMVFVFPKKIPTSRISFFSNKICGEQMWSELLASLQEKKMRISNFSHKSQSRTIFTSISRVQKNLGLGFHRNHPRNLGEKPSAQCWHKIMIGTWFLTENLCVSKFGCGFALKTWGFFPMSHFE